MIILDFMFLKIYRFVLRIKNDEGNSKWSSLLYLSLFVTMATIVLILISGLIWPNPIIEYFKLHSFEFWMSTAILSPLVLSIRYYKLVKISEIEERYDGINKAIQTLCNLFIYLLLIITPISSFILFRNVIME